MNENLKITNLNCNRLGLNNINLNTLSETQEVIIPTKYSTNDLLNELIYKLEYLWQSKIHTSQLNA